MLEEYGVHDEWSRDQALTPPCDLCPLGNRTDQSLLGGTLSMPICDSFVVYGL